MLYTGYESDGTFLGYYGLGQSSRGDDYYYTLLPGWDCAWNYVSECTSDCAGDCTSDTARPCTDGYKGAGRRRKKLKHEAAATASR